MKELGGSGFDDVLPGFKMTVDELFRLLILRRPAEGERVAE